MGDRPQPSRDRLSWLDPATAVGLSLTKLGELLGPGSHQDILLGGSRDVAAVFAAVISVRLLLACSRRRDDAGDRVTLLAVVFLGPTMQPWYVAWSMVVLATSPSTVSGSS